MKCSRNGMLRPRQPHIKSKNRYIIPIYDRRSRVQAIVGFASKLLLNYLAYRPRISRSI
ncbi:MAG: hypothetical protein F6J93_05900 [Oscillatoria sp. SIO1A7]|nr:hypothetical protein [Oscillatoria sp. SIO1A7]